MMLKVYNESLLKSYFLKFYDRYIDLVCDLHITGVYVELFVSYPLLDCRFHTSFDNG
jgi:hypothetical protein